MHTLPLELRDGHLFVELSGELWLLDTGAPTSFGTSRTLSLAGQEFQLGTSYLDLTAANLSEYVGVPCAGLLGADILGCFDHIFDTGRGRLTVSTAELSHTGQRVGLDEFMGIPIVTARVGGRDYRMFFDTGAQLSYFEDDSLGDFPAAGVATDFHPSVGRFQTDTRNVAVMLGGVGFLLRCGALPGALGRTLMMAG